MKISEELAVIILAAGLGKRMKSELPKVMIECDSSPIIDYVFKASLALKAKKTVVVTGYKRELVESHLNSQFESSLPQKSLLFAYQKDQRGTGDAVKSALPYLDDFVGPVVIIYGDVPLLTSATLNNFIKVHQTQSATLSVLTVRTLFPAEYGRIIRDKNGALLSIKEHKDCSEEERLINEINSGIYVVDSSFLRGAVQQLKNDNAQAEYYLTDIVAQAAKEGQNISSMVLNELTEVQGVNNRIELAETAKRLKTRRIHALIESGVSIDDPDSVEIAKEVTIAAGARVGSHVIITGSSIIEAGAIIEGFSVINDSKICQNAVLRPFSHLEGAYLGPDCTVGPFARLREGTHLEGENRIGNFVETKKARLKKGAKANHLTYLGDCTVGENSNIGAGTITCNYDGKKKSQTVIGKDCFIGSNSALVAPVTINDGAFIGAGSVITKNVSADSLALGRASQTEIEGWALKKKSYSLLKVVVRSIYHKGH